MTTSDHKIGYLDGWRGVAIMLVLVGHFGPLGWGPIAKLGVTLFFVLSGFFMAKLLFIKEVRLDSFFVRRFTRVMPALWTFLVAMIGWALYVQPTRYVPESNEVLASFLFLRTYLPADVSIWADQWPTSHLWSLNVEEHSYLFLALIAVGCSRLKSKVPAVIFMALSVLASIAFSIYYAKVSAPDGASPWFVRSECAALGIIASACYCTYLHYHSARTNRWLPLLALVALLLATLVFTPLIPTTRAKTLLMVVGAPLLCAFAINHAADLPGVVKNFLSSPLLRWFGTYSFSIYLWQQPLHFYAKETTLPGPVCLGIAIVLGVISFRCIENPLRVYLNSRWEARLTRRAASTAAMA